MKNRSQDLQFRDQHPWLSGKMSPHINYTARAKVNQMARYSEDFKNAIINKILSPESKSIRSVASESNLPIGTVLNWLKQKNINVPMEKYPPTETKETIQSSQVEQFNIILETAPLSAEEVNAYCRKKGIYASDIEVWKQEMLDNLDSRNKKTLERENNTLKVQVRELKQELSCKEKALAESAALLLLKKKASIIWEVPEDES